MAKNSMAFLLLAAALAPTVFAQSALSAAYNGYSYLGCRTDSSSARTLSALGPAVQGDMTIEKCIDVCSSYSRYVGLEFGGECWCGNAIASTAAIAPDTSCNTPCVGNANEACGGADRISIYQNPSFVPAHTNGQSQAGNPNGQEYTIPVDIGAGYEFVACIADTDDLRAVPPGNVYAGVSLETCAIQCRDQGGNARYIGMNYGRECFCGNNLRTIGGVSNGCTFQCEAKAGEACGGLHAVQVYSNNQEDWESNNLAPADGGNSGGSTTTSSTDPVAVSRSSSNAAAEASRASVTSSRVAASARVSSSRAAALASITSSRNAVDLSKQAFSASRDAVRVSVSSSRLAASNVAAASRSSVTSSRLAASAAQAASKVAVSVSKGDVSISVSSSRAAAAASRSAANANLSSSRAAANALNSVSRDSISASKATSAQIVAASKALVTSSRLAASISVSSSKAAAAASKAAENVSISSSRAAANLSLSQSRSAANASQSSSRAAANAAKTPTTLATSTTTTAAAGQRKMY